MSRSAFALVGLLTLPLVIGACTKSEPAAPAPSPTVVTANDAVLTSIAADAPTCGEVASTCGDDAASRGGEEKASCCRGAAKHNVAQADEPSCGAHADHGGAVKNSVQVAFDQAPAHGDKALCLVMNREFVVDERTSTSVYNGKTYAFCCDGCKQVFDENPAKFVHADVKANAKAAAPSKS